MGRHVHLWKCEISPAARVTLLAILAVLVLLPFHVAKADWEYTRWDMTPEEVMAASGGSLVPVPEAEQAVNMIRERFLDPLLRGRHQIAPGIDMELTFFFDDSRSLAQVYLRSLNRAQFAGILEALKRRLGEPDDVKGGHILAVQSWDRGSDQDSVSFIIVTGDTAAVIITPPVTLPRLARFYGTLFGFVTICRENKIVTDKITDIWRSFVTSIESSTNTAPITQVFDREVERALARRDDQAFKRRRCTFPITPDAQESWSNQLQEYLLKNNLLKQAN